MSFEIYQADSKTGMQGSLIEETAQSFAAGTTNYETTYKFTSLKENACITVVVLGTDGHTYQRNLLVEITPSVLFSDPDYGKDGENKLADSFTFIFWDYRRSVCDVNDR